MWAMRAIARHSSKYSSSLLIFLTNSSSFFSKEKLAELVGTEEVVGEEEKSIGSVLTSQKDVIHFWHPLEHLSLVAAVVGEVKNISEAFDTLLDNVFVVGALGQNLDEAGKGTLVEEGRQVLGVYEHDVQEVVFYLNRLHNTDHTVHEAALENQSQLRLGLVQPEHTLYGVALYLTGLLVMHAADP